MNLKILNINSTFRFIVLFMIILTAYACNKSLDKKTMEKIENLIKLKKEPKFVETAFYPGLEKKENKTVLSDLLNESIDEFTKGTENNFNDTQYQELMKECLKKFDVFNLDTEDREYICGYFEKIMDAIELKSSGGILNQWLYGFDVEK